MLYVILQILCVIGIILFSILGLLLLLVLLVLFVPIRYRIKVGKQTDIVLADVKITYLLHLLSVKCTYENNLQIVAKICGIKVYDSNSKNILEEEKTPFVSSSAKEPSLKDQFPETDTMEMNSMEINSMEINSAETNSAEQESSKKESFFAKIKKRFWDMIAKIRYTIFSIYDKIKNVIQNISYYKQVLDASENRIMYKRVWSRILKVLKSIRPRKAEAELLAGTGSPDTTGYLCALYGMLSPVLGKHVSFTADFEEKICKGSVFVKGRITIFTLLVQALKLFFDKQIRIFIKQLKKEAM